MGIIRPINRAAMSEPFLLRLTPDEHEALRAKAVEEERTMAQTLRRALRAYLEAK